MTLIMTVLLEWMDGFESSIVVDCKGMGGEKGERWRIETTLFLNPLLITLSPGPQKLDIDKTLKGHLLFLK